MRISIAADELTGVAELIDAALRERGHEVIRHGALSAEERDQLNAYHARVLAVIGPQLDGEARAWLDEACAPI